MSAGINNLPLERAERPVKHYSVFGLAAQPLLIKLGTLFGDIFPADVYQLKKEPQSTWAWFEDDPAIVNYIINKSEHKTNTVALKFSLSAKISDERVTKVLGDDCSIWELTTNNPHNDFIRRKEHLSDIEQWFEAFWMKLNCFTARTSNCMFFRRCRFQRALN
jgi:hypothetical protein